MNPDIFLELAALLVPILIFAQQSGSEVSIYPQAIIIVVASWICQLLRRKPLAELIGEFNVPWLK